MKLLTAAANAAWCTSSVPAYLAFHSSLADPRRAQLRLLSRYIQRNSATAFGRLHGFDCIDGVDVFRRAVPIRDCDGFAPWIDRIASGEKSVLTAERVSRLIPSSGSTRAAKLIPYTPELQREFNRAIGPWIVDLYRDAPGLMCGSAYWSITPAAHLPQQERASAIPVGFDDDSAYLGGLRKRLVDAVMAVPGDVRHLHDMHAFRFATLRHLLGRQDLRLISVWHPSFLELLLDAARDQWPQLVDAIAQVHPARAAALRRISPGNWRAAWPHLRLISCWADANAAGPADALRRHFPHVAVQPKGLLATEAFVSIPFTGRTPLAVRSHFLEFEDDDGSLFLADELRSGGDYGVIVTTGGGLWRYRLGDRIRCDGHLGRTACVRFIGRNDLVTDHFGEKLSEGFVSETVRRLLVDAQIESNFAMLAPDREDDSLFYTLFLSTSAKRPTGLGLLSVRLDTALRSNPHYANCRDLGQLQHPRLFRIDGPAYPAYVAAACQAGRRLGDVKPLALHPASIWANTFVGKYLDRENVGPLASTHLSSASKHVS